MSPLIYLPDMPCTQLSLPVAESAGIDAHTARGQAGGHPPKCGMPAGSTYFISRPSTIPYGWQTVPEAVAFLQSSITRVRGDWQSSFVSETHFLLLHVTDPLMLQSFGTPDWHLRISSEPA